MFGPQFLAGFSMFRVWLDRADRADRVAAPSRKINAFGAAEGVDGIAVEFVHENRAIDASADANPAADAIGRDSTTHGSCVLLS
jgi:hypothetical protein